MVPKPQWGGCRLGDLNVKKLNIQLMERACNLPLHRQVQRLAFQLELIDSQSTILGLASRPFHPPLVSNWPLGLQLGIQHPQVVFSLRQV